MNQAALGSAWFRGRGEASDFLARIGESCAAFPVDLHAFCVLPGHYHLLVRAELGPLRESLAHLESGAGSPAGRSARAVPVGFGRHLMSVSRYIHLNPVDAGLVWCPEHWPYSSFRAYLGDVSAPRWIVTEAVLGRFGTIGARHRHRAYVYAGLDPHTRDGDGRPRWSTLFGAGSPAEDLAWRIEPVLTHHGLIAEATPPGTPRLGLRELARAIAAAFDVPVEALRSVRTRGPSAAAARGAFVHAARSQGGYRLRDVAAFMGYRTPSAAAAVAERFDRTRRLVSDTARLLG